MTKNEVVIRSKFAVVDKVANLVLTILLYQQPISIQYVAQLLIVAAIQCLAVGLQLLNVFVVQFNRLLFLLSLLLNVRKHGLLDNGLTDWLGVFGFGEMNVGQFDCCFS